MDGDPSTLDATGLLEAFRARALSPLEALDAALARIEAADPRLNAFRLVDADRARAAAQAATQRWARRAPQGRLVVLPEVGHAAMTTSRCGAQAFARFFAGRPLGRPCARNRAPRALPEGV